MNLWWRRFLDVYGNCEYKFDIAEIVPEIV